ncbi:MAG: hypothetical protein ACFCU1_11210 [Sumerlaeia bacterium]
MNVRSDLRMLATAVEVYYLDNNAYPTWTTDKEFSLNYSLMEQTTNADWSTPSFRNYERNNQGPFSLTTPIAYITEYPVDPYAKPIGRSFNFYSTQNNWIAWSPGPDGIHDIPWQLFQENPDLLTREWLLDYNNGSLTYDPSNGTLSSGDIWRIRD